MNSASDLDREQEGWDRTQSVLARVLPYLLLAVSTAITVMQAIWGVPVDLPLALGLTGAAALWLILFIVAGSQRWNPMLLAVYYAGFAVLSAALVIVAPWYGIFAFVGYLHAFECLRGRWRYVGVVSTSMTMSVTYMGGIDRIDREEWWLWATVTVVGIGLSALFFSGAETLDRHSLRQRRAVVELHEANTRLSSALEENSALQERLVAGAREAGVLAERQRMAREIHDTLAQGLAGILTQLEAAEAQGSSAGTAARHLRNARALARDSLAEARRSVHSVQPSELTGVCLPEALEAVSARWAQVNDISARAISVEVECTGTPQPLDREIESALLRIAQEALANVAQHAAARTVRLTLSSMDEVVALDVRDDGVGFRPEPVPSQQRADGGFGILGMRQRAENVGGTLTIESEPGLGTVVSATVPCRPDAAAGMGPAAAAASAAGSTPAAEPAPAEGAARSEGGAV